jgi:hypothetical protein
VGKKQKKTRPEERNPKERDQSDRKRPERQEETRPTGRDQTDRKPQDMLMGGISAEKTNGHLGSLHGTRGTNFL